MIMRAAQGPTTVLLVEDNPGDARLIREYLRDVGGTGIRFEHVDRLGAALDRLATGGVDAILLDLGLPDSQGMESFEAIRRAVPDEPIIVVSGLDDRERALHAVAAGAQDYLVKGRFDGPVLVRVVQYAVQRKRAERALHQSDDRFRAFVENGNEGIAVFDAGGVITYCSPSTARILGYDAGSLIGRRGLEFVRSSDRPRVVAMLARARANPGEGCVDRAQLKHGNGSWRLIETTVTNMLESPAVRGFVFNYRDVTEQARSAELVQWLSVAVDQGSTAVMMFDPSGTIEYVNRKFTEDTGYASEESIGKATRLLRADGYDERYDDAWTTMRAGLPFRGEMPCRAKNGRVYWTDLQVWPVRDSDCRVTHFVGFHIDITARREMDERLRQSNVQLAESSERFRLLSEVTFDGIAIIRDGVVIEANVGLTRLLGLESEGTIIGRQWIDFVHPFSREQMADRLAGGAEGRCELQIVRSDGGVLSTEATVRRHSMEGRAVQIMAVRDITESRAVEQRLLQAQKMEAVGQLAGGVAHDFNNILAAILMTAELGLQDTSLSSQMREDIGTIHAAAKRGADITRQLLTFSRKQVTTPRAVDVGALLEEMQPMLDQLITANMSIETLPAATRGVEADPIQLEQIILNLVVNARDAMPAGGSVRVESQDVDIAVATRELALRPGPYLLLSVTDTGIGIEESIRPHLFEPFFTTKPPGKGTGLGLSTIAGIVRSLEGAIRVHSTVGKGTTFEIYLPALMTPGRAPAGLAPGESPRGTETILVVEDETLVRGSICRILRSLGYRTIEAKNGEDGLLIRGRHDGPVDLVVTDVVMPGMTGPAMLAELRRADPGLPAVIVSGYNDTVVDIGGLPPLTAFLAKPFTSRGLASRVRQQIDAARSSFPPEPDHGHLTASAGAVG